jgi:hypothetical protein
MPEKKIKNYKKLVSKKIFMCHSQTSTHKKNKGAKPVTSMNSTPVILQLFKCTKVQHHLTSMNSILTKYYCYSYYNYLIYSLLQL